MAGFYPDAPDRRMAWDADGTISLWLNDNQTGFEHDSAKKIALNNEDPNIVNNITSDNGFGYVIQIFPELRDVDGYFISRPSARAGFSNLDESSDTTNGISGTWNTEVANVSDPASTIPDWREDINTLSAVASKAIRVYKNSTTGASDHVLGAIHIYGTISAGETPDRILFLDTENSDAEFVKPLDWGEVPRGQTQTRTFKIKNNSSSLSINTISVTAEDLYLNAGGWYEFGEVGGPYSGTYAVGNLANGAEELIELKQVIPDGETLGLQTARIRVSHASLS